VGNDAGETCNVTGGGATSIFRVTGIEGGEQLDPVTVTLVVYGLPAGVRLARAAEFSPTDIEFVVGVVPPVGLNESQEAGGEAESVKASGPAVSVTERATGAGRVELPCW
jgi:hypothetical protein